MKDVHISFPRRDDRPCKFTKTVVWDDAKTRDMCLDITVTCDVCGVEVYNERTGRLIEIGQYDCRKPVPKDKLSWRDWLTALFG